MKSFLFISVLILAFCRGSFAQTDKISTCPTIDMTGPAGTVEPATPITFTASLSKEAEKFNLGYKWTVSNGEVIEGQETLIVKVLLKDLGKALTVSLQIISLPKECANTVTETLYIDALPPNPIWVKEFSIPVSQIDKTELDSLRAELKNKPGSIAYIIENFERKTSRKAIAQKNKTITDYLKNNGIKKDSFVLLNSLTSENLTRFFIIAPEGTPPGCDECIPAN